MCNNCNESRRDFLRKMGFGAAALAVGTFDPLTAKFAHATTPGKILVTIQLDGGPDALNIVPAVGLSRYHERRPTIAHSPGSVLSLGSSIVGLNPSLPNIHAEFQGGNAAIVLQAAYENASRSHADAERHLATAARHSSINTGWMGRMMDEEKRRRPSSSFIGWSFAGGKDVVNAMNVTATTASSLSGFGLETDWAAGSSDRDYRNLVLETGLRGATTDNLQQQKLKSSLVGIYDAVDAIQTAQTSYGTRPVSYPGTGLGNRLRDIATLINAGMGRFFVAAQGGHDTHGDQNQRENNQLLPQLDAAVGAFIADMKAIGKYNDVVILILGEFGRNTYENGNGGTDHGVGQNPFVIGGSVRGGLYGDTPTNTVMNERWLRNSVDMRNIYREIALSMGYAESLVLPESYARVNLGLL